MPDTTISILPMIMIIYVHYGQSKYALSRIEDDNIMTIHGLSGYESKVFYRSSDRKAPHNVYTTGKMLAEDLKSQALPEIIRQDIHRDCSFNRNRYGAEIWNKCTKVNIPF